MWKNEKINSCKQISMNGHLNILLYADDSNEKSVKIARKYSVQKLGIIWYKLLLTENK